MTEKRFTVPDRYQFSHSKVQLNGEPLTNDEIVRLLNTNDGAFFENFKLKKENKEIKDLLKSMADRNKEIWLDNGQIIRLKKVFKGEWTND